MIEIKDLLVEFSNLLIKEEVKKVAIMEVLSEIIGVKIKTEAIKIKNNIIYLNIKPIYKNEIMLKQEQIFLKLKEILGKKTPTALR